MRPTGALAIPWEPNGRKIGFLLPCQARHSPVVSWLLLLLPGPTNWPPNQFWLNTDLGPVQRLGRQSEQSIAIYLWRRHHHNSWPPLVPLLLLATVKGERQLAARRPGLKDPQ